MKQKLILWLISLLQPTFTTEQKTRIKRAKSLFYRYFADTNDSEPVSKVDLFYLGITNLQFTFNGNTLIMTITLTRPGLLIGKGGKQRDDIERYLSFNAEPVTIKIIESKLWNYNTINNY